MRQLFLLLCFCCVWPAEAQLQLWECNFNSSTWLAGWDNTNDPPKVGIAFGSTNITRYVDATAPGGAYLRIAYPAGSYVPSGSPPAPIGGTQFYGAVLHTNGNSPLDAVILQYSVRFPTNFNYVMGGKLPGLYGGTGNTGSDFPTGMDGFTTRFMWRASGAGEAYPFLPTSAPNDGTELGKGNWYFTGDAKWHTLKQQCTLNTVGASNGVIQTWYDGALVLTATGLFFRSTNTLHIDGVIFQTFFGGDATDWATPVNTYADFAAFSVSDPNQNAPILSITPSGTNVVICWPTNCGPGFLLEKSSSIMSTNDWSSLSGASISDGQYVLTNAIGLTNTFYRLLKSE